MVDLDLFLQRERLFTQPLDGANREPSLYPALYEFKPSIRSNARSRSR
jgi:hypothetical protein